MRRSELTNQRFGRLGKTRMVWRCVCDCGKETHVTSDNLTGGHTKSCGCLRVDTVSEIGRRLATHGDTKDGTRSPEYLVHTSIVQRTTNSNHKVFSSYGGAGRTICEGLRSFSGFIQVVGRRPSPQHSIDRWPNNKTGGYWCGECVECKEKGQPRNVRWATPEEQRQNMEDSRQITINGETHCIAEWERIAGLHVDRIRARIKMGWPIDESLLQPPKYNSKKKTA
jgi:hypothetical protein